LLSIAPKEIITKQNTWKGKITKEKINAFLHSPAIRYLLIAFAVICFIMPDPFSDILAFWLLAKTGMSINYKSLLKKFASFLW